MLIKFGILKPIKHEKFYVLVLWNSEFPAKINTNSIELLATEQFHPVQKIYRSFLATQAQSDRLHYAKTLYSHPYKQDYLGMQKLITPRCT